MRQSRVNDAAVGDKVRVTDAQVNDIIITGKRRGIQAQPCPKRLKTARDILPVYIFTSLRAAGISGAGLIIMQALRVERIIIHSITASKRWKAKACVTGIVIFTLMRIPHIRAWWDRLLQKIADRLVGRTDSVNTVLLLDYISGDSIAVVTLKRIPEPLQGIPLSETGLRSDTGILILLVEHIGQKAVPAGGDSVFAVGDKLTVFGSYAAICKTFHAREHFTDDR